MLENRKKGRDLQYFKPGRQSQVTHICALWRVVDIEIYGHVGLDLFIGVDCSVFLILSLIIHHLLKAQLNDFSFYDSFVESRIVYLV